MQRNEARCIQQRVHTLAEVRMVVWNNVTSMISLRYERLLYVRTGGKEEADQSGN